MGKRSNTQQINRTRLTWVLALLVASMTVGTVFLGVLEPDHAISAEARYLAATYNTDRASRISQTQTPISEKWDAVIIHRVRSDLRLPELAESRDQVPPAVHFAIAPDSSTLVTTQWEGQQGVEGYSGKIHIGVQLNPGQGFASLPQAEAVVALIRDLQARCEIAADRVFVYSQLTGSEMGNPLEKFYWRQSLLQ